MCQHVLYYQADELEKQVKSKKLAEKERKRMVQEIGLSDTESEARALLKWKASLKNQTLNSWILNPNNKTSHRGWIGIDCNDQARVTGVSLVRFNLNGTLDQFDFPSLPCLATLDLSFNHLDGTIPATIGTLSNLTDLALLRNGFSTPIPNSLDAPKHFNPQSFNMWSEFKYSSSNWIYEEPVFIGSLREPSHRLSGSLPSSISGLPLVTLFTDDNNFSGAIPADFGQSNQLEDINFSSNSFYGALPSRVCDNNKLMYFDASYYSFMGLLPESLRNCTSLIWLSLNKNYLDGNISEDLGNYPDLSGLYISENQFFGFIPQNIGKTMPNLTFLSVGNNHITGPIPSTLMSLQYLNASYNHITGNIPSSMPNMMRLSLSNNLITGSTSASVGNMSELAIFNLSENNLTGTMPSLPPTLNYFMISNNHIMGNIPNSIGYLSNVYILDVYGNGLSGIIPPSSGNCSLLEVLDLSNNNLLENIPWSLGNLENLLTFRLNDNKLSGEIPSSLKNCSNLEIIDFGENQLSGDIPPWIGESLS
ncbi:probable leucine-rich repeat receptor-like protein kinase At1g35710 [Amborella trichopoda]|uniref:probable leucine-rich repeat receptor-like protein kinase At1g35710 n=1 Tax=Amborella trichopoda TaxID=13333 RepID=UPI0005D2FE6F|nr:probable leucine-rich repeat receptor-like protein kinase At1g35710 [Amborella trichopoda]|eukprot:XP_011626118.1 probable leucine-rich repeat receptor-like protein kinase At1g35710 [Amborella trichopoda]